MVGWHLWLHGHEFEQASRVGDRQGSLACCSPCGRKESDMTEWMNWLAFWGDSQVVLVVKNPPVNAGDMRCGFDPWVRKMPWRRKWQPTPVFLSAESHGERSLVGYSPWDHKELDTTEWLAFWDGPHSAYGMCISLNKSLWFAFEFFPKGSQGTSLGGLSQGLTWDLGHDHPLCVLFSCNKAVDSMISIHKMSRMSKSIDRK